MNHLSEQVYEMFDYILKNNLNVNGLTINTAYGSVTFKQKPLEKKMAKSEQDLRVAINQMTHLAEANMDSNDLSRLQKILSTIRTLGYDVLE